MQTRLTMIALAGAVALGGAALASNETKSSEAEATLTAAETEVILRDAGYTMTEWEIGDGQIEAEGDKDGASWEVVIDARTGTILSVEQDD